MVAPAWQNCLLSPRSPCDIPYSQSSQSYYFAWVIIHLTGCGFIGSLSCLLEVCTQHDEKSTCTHYTCWCMRIYEEQKTGNRFDKRSRTRGGLFLTLCRDEGGLKSKLLTITFNHRFLFSIILEKGVGVQVHQFSSSRCISWGGV